MLEHFIYMVIYNGCQMWELKRELKAKEPRHNIHNILEESRQSKNVVQRESYGGGRGLVSSGSATQGEE